MKVVEVVDDRTKVPDSRQVTASMNLGYQISPQKSKQKARRMSSGSQKSRHSKQHLSCMPNLDGPSMINF